MANNGFQISYANERPPSSTGSGDADITSDPASSSFFFNDFKNGTSRHEDLKQMLDSNKDNLTLEAMKRIIGMVAKGKDASDLFPAVVKNVVSKNIEVKKLVYVYLTRYAEEQQDLALLSISTFQRALKDPNQLIRASALRVLSSIRVPMIVPIMMLAIKEAVMDMSPYVRKTAAHAIPKLYSLDPEQKDILIEVIEKLLADKTTLVAGSAIQAFEEVCPERIDLIHKNYRKLCNLLVDVEEWGQVVIINMLTRYARTQFVTPNQEDCLDENDEKAFYDSDDSDRPEELDDRKLKKKAYVMDQDHRLLLRTCRPLLNSRNAAVVMSVAQLYHHCAPKAEVGTVARALIRLLRGRKEVQYVVLSNIASISVKRKRPTDKRTWRMAGMFEPFLKSFYVRSNDPTHVKLLKLEILTNLASESNISTILREFQTYVTSADPEFAAATIQAIGRCASTIDEVTDTCLNGLVSLLSNRSETVVGESVVVIKKLLQMRPTEHKEIIVHLAKLAESITVPMAQASILWLIGEYSDRVPKIAPDVLRKMAKSFVNQEDIVKLQILNLAAKLCIINSKQTKLLCQYVFNLAKYDQNYDIRDRCRFLRQLILPGEKAGALSKHAKKIFLATKPAPVLESSFKDRDQFQLGTLSHLINTRATGYQELPEWPETAPDPGVRNVDVPVVWTEPKVGKKKPEKKKSFYSESESTEGDSSEETTSSDEDKEEGDESSSGEEDESGSEEETESEEETDSDEDSDDDEEDEEEEKKPKAPKAAAAAAKREKTPSMDLLGIGRPALGGGGGGKGRRVEAEEEEEDEEEESSEEESSEESSEEESSSEEEVVRRKSPVKAKADAPKQKGKASKKAEPATRPTDMLLDLDDFATSAADSTPILSSSDVLSPTAAMAAMTVKEKAKPIYSFTSPTAGPQPSHELLNRMSGAGLAAVYRFTRTMSVFSPKMVSVEVIFTNHGDTPVTNIKIGQKKLKPGMDIQDFPEISTLGPGACSTVLMAIDFNDTTQPAQFQVKTQEKAFSVSVTAPIGELLQPNMLSENDFVKLQGKLTGMNENSGSVDLSSSNNNAQTISSRVHEVANVLQVPSADDRLLRFAAKTVSSGSDILIAIMVNDNDKANIVINCDKMVFGSMLLTQVKNSLTKV